MISLSLATLLAPAQDWPGVARYNAANKEVKGPVTAILIGDSITDFWASRRPDWFRDNGFLGRGISGQVSTQMLARFSLDVVALHPKVVVINAGTNDVGENQGTYDPDLAYGSIISMVQLAQANGIRPILTSVLPAAKFPWRTYVTDAPEKIAALNARLKAYAQANGLCYVDYHPVLSDDGIGIKAEYAKDGIHPTLAGYEAMEPLVVEAVSKVLKARRYGKKAR